MRGVKPVAGLATGAPQPAKCLAEGIFLYTHTDTGIRFYPARRSNLTMDDGEPAAATQAPEIGFLMVYHLEERRRIAPNWMRSDSENHTDKNIASSIKSRGVSLNLKPIILGVMQEF